MSKLRIGQIIIENGNITFQQQSSTEFQSSQTDFHSVQSFQSIQSSYSTVHQPTVQNSTEKPTLRSIASLVGGSPSLWITIGFISLTGGIILTALFLLNILSVFAFLPCTPLLGLGVSSIAMGIIKSIVAKRVHVEKAQIDDAAQSEDKAKILSLLTGETEWTFEKIEERMDLPTKDLLVLIKKLMDQGQIVEELNEKTGNWFYVLGDASKKLETPQTIEERLRKHT